MVIYKITNLINNKIYIGQTVCSIESRWKNHLSKNSCGRIFKYEKNWDGVLVPEIKQEDFKKSKPVIHVNTGKIYKNTKEASLDTGLNHGSIRQSVSGKKAFKTHIFQYTNL